MVNMVRKGAEIRENQIPYQLGFFLSVLRMKPEIIKNNCWHMSHSALSKFNTISLTRDVDLHSHNQYRKNLVLYLFPININTLKINDENVKIIHNYQNFNHTCQKEN